MKRYIGYFRVSTDRQGRSGLGLEAQTVAVRDFVMKHGELVAEYIEVESGKRSDRPKLAQAFGTCASSKCYARDRKTGSPCEKCCVLSYPNGKAETIL